MVAVIANLPVYKVLLSKTILLEADIVKEIARPLLPLPSNSRNPLSETTSTKPLFGSQQGIFSWVSLNPIINVVGCYHHCPTVWVCW